MLNCVVDLSHWNASVDFAEVARAGIVGVIHKSSEGWSVVDSEYHERKQEALDQNLLWGAYHFGIDGDVRGQVAHFLETVQPGPQDLLVLDWEDCTHTLPMGREDAELFVLEVEAQTGRFPGLYSGMSFLQQQMGSMTAEQTPLSQSWLWIARYSSLPPVVPPAWTTYSLWQYSDGVQGPEPHTVPGIGPCDRDLWNGDLAGLQRLWGVTAPPLVG